VTGGVSALAAVGAALLGMGLLAGPATAGKKCELIPRSPLVPHLISPCNGATVREKANITFTVYDADPQAKRFAPFLNLQTSRRLVKGHLPANTDGDGVFVELKAVKGRAHHWTATAKDEIYPQWWDNHPGTYYVQVQQVGTLVSYSPIVTIHVR
jgi:hypothetical protein